MVGRACGTPRPAGVVDMRVSPDLAALPQGLWRRPAAPRRQLRARRHPARLPRGRPRCRPAVAFTPRRRRAPSQWKIWLIMLRSSIALPCGVPCIASDRRYFCGRAARRPLCLCRVWASSPPCASAGASESTFAVAAAWHAYNAMCRPNVSLLLTYRVTGYSAVSRSRKCTRMPRRCLRSAPSWRPCCLLQQPVALCVFACPALPPGGMLVGSPASGRRSMACL